MLGHAPGSLAAVVIFGVHRAAAQKSQRVGVEQRVRGSDFMESLREVPFSAVIIIYLFCS